MGMAPTHPHFFHYFHPQGGNFDFFPPSDFIIYVNQFEGDFFCIFSTLRVISVYCFSIFKF